MKQVAFIYDFDGTLSPRNMQEYDFLRAVGIDDAKAFWKECDELMLRENANGILCSMRMMLEKSREKHVPVTRETFVRYGRSVELYAGVTEWFEATRQLGRELGLEVHHYINSSGMAEIIEGTPIYKEFDEVYASRFMYDENGVAVWPATAVDFTSKTQVLWMINKGIQKVCDAARINQPMPQEERPVPFSHMLYFGDGETDVPSMQVVKMFGGHAFAVYNPDDERKQHLAEQLVAENRAHFALPANYGIDKALFEQVRQVLTEIRNNMSSNQ